MSQELVARHCSSMPSSRQTKLGNYMENTKPKFLRRVSLSNSFPLPCAISLPPPPHPVVGPSVDPSDHRVLDPPRLAASSSSPGSTTPRLHPPVVRTSPSPHPHTPEPRSHPFPFDLVGAPAVSHHLAASYPRRANPAQPPSRR